MRRLLALVLLIPALVLSACAADGEESRDPTTVDVVATTPQIADFVRQVGGDHVRVYDMIRPGIDPHDFEPSPANLQQIADADVIVRNGAGYDHWLDDTIASAQPRGQVVDASRGVQLRMIGNEADPHIWQNPLNAKVMVNNIVEALKAASSQNAADFDVRNADYQAKLDALDRDIAGHMEALPSKKLVTDHGALGYFADRYGLTIVGTVIPSFDSQAELSAQQINDLVSKIRAENVKAIFVEQAMSTKSAETIASESGARVVGGKEALFADTMGERDGLNTYIGVMRHNAASIEDALGDGTHAH